MCCLLAVAAFFGPRALGFVWWLLEPVRWGTAFPTAIIGLLGWAFLPWTTVAYVFVYTNGMDVLDWALVIVAIFVDFASYGGSAYRRKDLGWNY